MFGSKIMPILVTGFDVFLEHQLNPSWEIAKALDQTTILGHLIHAIKLPVRFDECATQIKATIQQLQPSIIICLGLAANRNCISIERVAINLDDAIVADQNNFQPIDRRIIDDADNAYFSTLAIKQIFKNLHEHQIPAEISYSAGTYVCNHLFFHVMHYIHHLNDHSKIQAGFIHVPLISNQCNEPQNKSSIDDSIIETAQGLSLDLQIQAIRLSIESCIQYGEQPNKDETSAQLQANFSAGKIS